MSVKEGMERHAYEATILSVNELVDRIYKGDSLPQDKRFLSVEKGGVFEYFNLEDLTGLAHHSEMFFPIIMIDDTIVGLAELEQDPNDQNNFWIKFVSVDPQFQNRGYATQLIKKIFEFAKERGCSLEPSFYSDEGNVKLKKVLERTQRETGVKFVRR